MKSPEVFQTTKGKVVGARVKIAGAVTAGAVFMSALSGCSDGSSSEAPISSGIKPGGVETLTPTPTSEKTATITATPTEKPKIPLDAYFKPNHITAPSVPSLANGMEMIPAQLDSDGQWVLPHGDPISLHVHDKNPNQIVAFGHSRWQGALQPAGDLILNAQIGDTILFNGETNLIPDSQERPGSEKSLTGIAFKLTEIIVSDERQTAMLMNDDQKYTKPTLILITSFRVNRGYDPSEYYVLSKDVVLEKATSVIGEIDNPDVYKHVIAKFEITDEGACTVIRGYEGKFTAPPGFLTPQEQCPTE